MYARDISETRTDDLVPEEVLPALDARRDRERDLARVRDHAVHGPLRRRHRQPVLVDLEPLQARHVRLRRVGHLRARQDVVSV